MTARLILSTTLAAGLLAVGGLTAAAAPAPPPSPVPVPVPAASPVPLTSPGTAIDLPAMVLRPSDLPGQGYGTVDGDVFSGIGGSLSDYMSSIAAFGQDDMMTRKILTNVTLFPDDPSAQAALDEELSMLGGDELTAPRQLVDGAPVIGDASFTTTFVGESTQGSPVNNVEVTMRVGPVVASVGISDFTGASPAAEELPPLADIVVSRVRDTVAQGLTGLSHRMLRLADTDPWAESFGFETYQVVDGTYLATAGEPVESEQARTAFFGTARVVDSFTFQQTLENSATGQMFELASWIYTFASDADALAYVELAVNDVVSNPGQRTGVARVEVAGAVGPAAGASMGFPAEDGTVLEGHRVWVQSGPTVVSVLVDRVGGVPVDVVRDLANAQVACAQSVELCAQVPVPAALLG